MCDNPLCDIEHDHHTPEDERDGRDGGDWHLAFAGMTIGPTPFDRDPFLTLVHAPRSISVPPKDEYAAENGERREG
jgi:hypothetical protein